MKHGTSVAPQVVERINTLDRKKFRNVGRISNLGWEPSAQSPSRNNTFAIAVNNYAEVIIKVFLSCQILLDFFISDILSVTVVLTLNMIMVAIYCYLKGENDKVLKFHLNNSSYFEISPPFNKCHTLTHQN